MEAPTNLEERIRSALTDEICSTDLAALIDETVVTISAADENAEDERARLLDPVASPDPAKAREAMQAAEFTRDRLRTVLPRLNEKLQRVRALEYAARWRPEFQRVEAQRDELAREFAETYPTLVAQLVDLFRRAEAMDSEVSRVNGSAPYGDHRRLLPVELVARGLDRFSADQPAIAPNVQFPEFDISGRKAWPPPTVPLAVQVISGMTFVRHPGADWAAEIKERAYARQAESARVAAYYSAAAKNQEDRENAEVRAARKR